MRLMKSGVKEYKLEMTGILAGDAAFITVPGELFTEIGLRIKRLSPFDHTWIIGLANGHVGYIPTQRAIREGGFATHTGVSCLATNADDIVTEEALALLGSLRARQTAGK